MATHKKENPLKKSPKNSTRFRIAYRNRSVKFTKEGTRFVLLTLGVGVAAINTGNNLLYLILAMMLSFIIVSGILSEQCIRKIRIKRKIPSPLYANTPFKVDLEVRNGKKFFPSFSLQLHDTLQNNENCPSTYFFVLGPLQEIQRGYSLELPQRGLYRFESLSLNTRFPFGLFIKTLTYPLIDEIVVYPQIEPISPSLSPFSSKKDEMEVNKKGHGTTLYQLREFQHGDDARTIHWKTSARHGRLLIRENETEEEKRVILVFDNRQGKEFSQKTAHLFEKGVTQTASLAFYFIQKGYALELVTANSHFPFSKGAQHLHKILHYLALVTPQTKDTMEENLLKSRGNPQDYRFLILGIGKSLWNGKEHQFTQILNASSPLRG
jgi:uncharacterized protein (DUF58 family)